MATWQAPIPEEGVIQPGGALMDIVPDGETLVIESRVNTTAGTGNSYQIADVEVEKWPPYVGQFGSGYKVGCLC